MRNDFGGKSIQGLYRYDTSYNYLYKLVWMIDEGMVAALAASVVKAEINQQYKFILVWCRNPRPMGVVMWD